MLGEDGAIRLRLVDHHALTILLEGWSADFAAAIPKGMPAPAARCVCPAHLGIFGSGMALREADDGIWHVLLNASIVSTYDKRGDRTGYVEPTPSVHAFPAVLDQAFLDDLGAGRLSQLDVDGQRALMSYYEASADALALWWPARDRLTFDVALEKVAAPLARAHIPFV